jgi:hypothetical protein
MLAVSERLNGDKRFYYQALSGSTKTAKKNALYRLLTEF